MSRLSKTYEYRRSRISAQTMAKMFVEILKQMAADEEIKEACTATAIVANSSCEDGTQLSLNDMFMAAKVAKLGKSGNLDDMIELKKAEIRRELVEDIAAAKYQDIVLNNKSSKKPDEVEVRMVYLLGLQKRLNLPIPPNQEMLYAYYSQVTDEDVEAAYQSVQKSMKNMQLDQVAKELINWPAFRDRLEEDYKGYSLEIGDKYYEQFEAAEKIITEWDTKTKATEIMQKDQDETVKEQLQQLTLEYLSGNPRKPYTLKDYQKKQLQ